MEDVLRTRNCFSGLGLVAWFVASGLKAIELSIVKWVLAKWYGLFDGYW